MEPKDNTNGTFINEADLGPELTEDNCTPELWQELNGDEPKDIPDQEQPF